MTINSQPYRPGRWKSPEYADGFLARKDREALRRVHHRRLLSLLPFQPDDIIRVLDVGTGGGPLGLEVLTAYPKAQLVCHDYSETMLAQARQRLAQFAAVVSFVKSDFKDSEWTQIIEGHFDAVVSSIAIHNVADSVPCAPDRIKAIYREILDLLKPGGCFLNYEFVAPPGPAAEVPYLKKRLADYQARPNTERRVEQSPEELEALMHIHVYHPPGSLLDQLDWLRQAGFDEVDCFWKDMDGTIIGGFKD